jgi:hypothetical protein
MLFECPTFVEERDNFERSTGLAFDYELLLEDNTQIIKGSVKNGREIFELAPAVM